MVALLDGAEREHATRVPLVASLVELATGAGASWSWSSCFIEYDPQLPYDSGSLEKAEPETKQRATELLTQGVAST